MDNPNAPKPFWTFSSKDIRFGASGIHVTGWFIWCHVTNIAPEGDEEHMGLRMHYLTPFDQPMTFELPISMVDGRLDTMNAQDVLGSLIKIFGDLPFQKVPEAPVELPLHKIPPSRREAIQRAIRNRGRGAGGRE